MTRSTVEIHLVRFIPTGEINLTDLVPEHKIENDHRRDRKNTATSEHYRQLRNTWAKNYTYGEIRAVLATM